MRRATIGQPVSRRLLRPFWNPAEGRVRAGWRFLAVLLLTAVGVGAAQALARATMSPVAARAAESLLAVAVALLVVAVAGRFLDRRHLSGYGLRPDGLWSSDFAVGTLLGVAIPAVTFGVGFAVGWLRVEEWLLPGLAPTFVVGLVVFAVAHLGAAVWEELVFRGHGMQNFAEGLGGRWSPGAAVAGGLVISTVVFAFLHAPQQLAGPVPLGRAALLWTVMGALFGLAYASTGELGLPIGLHFGFNVAVHPIFGLFGDLDPDTPRMIRLDVVGPEPLVGPAGLLLSGVAVLCALFLLLRGPRDRGGSLLDTGIAAPPERVNRHETSPQVPRPAPGRHRSHLPSRRR